MTLLVNLLWLTAGSALLYYGAGYLVRGGSAAAGRMGVSPLIIGLTLVAFGTSMPEFTVSVGSAVRGSADISLGNIIGSCICNIGLILGLCAVIRPLRGEPFLLKIDLPVMLLSSVLLAGMMFFGGEALSRLSGAVLLLLFTAYMWIRIRAELRRAGAGKTDIPEEASGRDNWGIVPALLIAAGGIAGVIAGADFFLRGAVAIARDFGISEAVIGLTLVAAGTSLPELATSLVAAVRGEADIAVGNVVGSNIFNILFILGVVPLIKPLHGRGITGIDLLTMLLLSVMLLPFAGRRGIGRCAGAAMFLVYLAYLVYLLFRSAV